MSEEQKPENPDNTAAFKANERFPSNQHYHLVVLIVLIITVVCLVYLWFDKQSRESKSSPVTIEKPAHVKEK